MADYEAENPYAAYDPNFNVDEVMMRLHQLQNRIASTLSKVDRQDGEIIEKQSQISQTVDEISLEVFESNPDGTFTSRIQQNADAIIQRVSYSDYTGNTITSLIAQDAYSINFLADQLNLVGLVSFSSLSTPGETSIDGGNITSGLINGSFISGGTVRATNYMTADVNTPFVVQIGSPLYTGMEVYNGSMRLYSTGSEYFRVSLGSFTWAGHQVATQDWVASQGYSTGGSTDFHPNSVDWVDTYRIQRGGASAKFLFGSATIQARNYSDSAYGTWEGLAYSNVSRREEKKDITFFTKNATEMIVGTPVHSYLYNSDLDMEPKRVGLIYDEAPMEIMQFTGGIDVYGMASVMWKALQELNERVTNLETTA